MLFLAADHRGFALKEKIKNYLSQKKIIFEDLGAFEIKPEDDYPDYAKILAKKMVVNPSASSGQVSLGVALCGSGAGMSIALNKFDGIRAGLAENVLMAEAMKKDDNINVLVLPADYIEENEAFLAIEKFLSAGMKSDLKYQRRLEKIKKIEENN